MSPVPPTLEQRLEVRVRPDGPAAMYQSWQHLLFLHWEADPEFLDSLLPSRLYLDLHQDKAYLGVVPFYMRGVRPRRLPAVPGLSNFFELNVRTYVYDDAGLPGVWFFSLDASNKIACAIARARFHLPYFDATICSDQRDGIYYQARRNEEDQSARFHYRPTGPAREAEPGSLEFFLLERYLLYAHDSKSDRNFRGQVHHAPYRLQEADVPQWSTLPIVWDGLPEPSGAPIHVCYSECVDVEVFGLHPLTAKA